MPSNNNNLQDIIEQICSAGCERVNEVIEILDRNETVEETKQLSPENCKALLHELKAIMSIYEQK